MRKVFLLLLLPLLISYTNTVYSQTDPEIDPLDKQIEKLRTLLKTVDYYYVDTVNNGDIVEKAIISMLENLDPHSVYIPKEELERMNEPLVGNFEGIGIRFNVLHDTIIVVSPISGGPSEKLGIRSGDKIVMIEDEVVAGKGISNSDVMDKLRGKKGTKVNISILRRGNPDMLEYTIVRDKIPLYSVDASYMATPEIGYIKVNRFARRTNTEMVEKISLLKEEGMEHLILDLRGNGGGYLETAFQMADEFLDDHRLIVYTEGLKHRKQEYHATAKGSFQKGKLVILMDEGSASASEIVAGAIQDWDRGLIIGRKSFGKGLVQKPFYLPDGSAVRLTTARYYTPSGRCIQKPYDHGKNDYYHEIVERSSNGELFLEDSIKFIDSLKYKTNGNRIVYGGGGIMPDIFVPLDTLGYSTFYQELARKGIFNEYILTYLDNYRETIKKQYPEFRNFRDEFNAGNSIYNDFISYAEKQGVTSSDEEKIADEKIELQLKALLAQNIWTASEYYEILNTSNDAYLEAIESIEGDVFKKSGLSYK